MVFKGSILDGFAHQAKNHLMTAPREPLGEAGGYAPIRDYALIGDCHGAALVSADGSIDWCCLERFDADPVLASLLDPKKGGAFEVRVDGTLCVVRDYLQRTNILRTLFATAEGQVVVTDFMPATSSAGEGGAPEAPGWLVRVVEGMNGRCCVAVRYRPLAARWGSSAGRLRARPGAAMLEGGPALYGNFPFEQSDGEVHVKVEVKAGERRFLVLAPRPLARPPGEAEIDHLLNDTRSFWESWLSCCCYEGPYAQAVTRSLLTLKMLTFAPTGAIVAAPTTSLPEALGGVRNWDYRYCWMRDSALTLYVLAAMGYRDEVEAFLSFVDRCAARSPELQIVYGIGGEAELVERTVKHFEGYAGSSPVRVGNAAHRQRQIDVYGEILDLFHVYRKLGGRIGRRSRERLSQLADFVAGHWHEPDQGLWEVRGPARHFVHGKMMSWVALDRALLLLGHNARWERERTAILNAIQNHGVSRERGHLVRSFGETGVDAALLLAPQLGFPIDKAAFGRTVAMIKKQLGHDGYLRRYVAEDGLHGEEGAFLMCSFWLVDALLYLGRYDEAEELFKHLLDQASDVGLYAEEINPRSGAFLGNFPQAFTHLALVNSALNFRLYHQVGPEALARPYADRAVWCVDADQSLCTQWPKRSNIHPGRRHT